MPPTRPVLQSEIVLLLIIVSANLLAYGSGLYGPFFLDDFANIGPANLTTFTWPIIWETVASNHSGWLGRSIPMLTFIANYGLFGEATFSFKAVNLALHLLCGIGLFFLGERVLRQIHGQSSTQTQMVALLVASLWLLHPLHVSTVLYVVQRMAQLSALFMIFGVLIYVLGRQRMLADQKNGLFFCVLSIVLFTPLAALSKENGLLLPVFILLVEATLFKVKALTQVQYKQLLFLLALLCVAPMLFGVGYVTTHFEHFVQGYTTREFTLQERLLTQVHALYFYLQLTFWPVPANMGLYHDDFPVTRILDTQTVFMLLGLVVAFISAILWFKKAPLATLGVLWFFLAHAVESTFLPLEMVFEHRNYMAIWGLLMATVFYVHKGVASLNTTMPLQTMRPVMAVALITVLASLTFFRTAAWKDQTTFTYSHYVDHPKSTRALIGMAGLYLSLNDTLHARQLIAQAQAINPSEPGLPLFNLYSYCNDTTPPDRVIQKAITPLAQGAWSIYANQMVYSLYLATNKNQCPFVSRHILLDIARAALKHHPIPNRQSTLELHIVHAGLLGDLGQIDAARKYFTELYNHPMKMPPNTREALRHKVIVLTTSTEQIRQYPH